MRKIFNFIKDQQKRDVLYLCLTVLVAVVFTGIMLGKISSITMCINTNDFYQYIQLGENIFQHGDFTMRHQTGETIAYPPVFSILIYLLTLITRDALISIYLLNTLAYGLSIYFIFMFARSLFNSGIAFLASLMYASSINCDLILWILSSHFFFGVTLLGLGWLNWSILRGKESPLRLFLCGIFACLTMLTKKVGMAYVPIIIFTYFLYNRGSDGPFSKKILKRIIFFLLGFFLIFLPYQIKVYQKGQDVKLYSNGTRAFLSGNYWFDPRINREREYYKLNKKGDDFALLDTMEQTSILSFIRDHPRYMLDKYANYSKTFFKTLAQHSGARNGSILIYFYGVFILLGITAFFSFSYFPQAFYVFLWLSPSLVLPFIFVKFVYVWPFLPLYFLFFIWGGRNIVHLFPFRRTVGALLIFVLFFVMIPRGMRNINKESYCYSSKDEYLKTAERIKEDAADSGKIKIMARKTYITYLTGADFIALPYEDNWNKVIRFALAKDVDYIVLSRKEAFATRSGLFISKPENENIKFLFKQDSRPKNAILVYKIINKEEDSGL